jgi:hypothetical protein
MSTTPGSSIYEATPESDNSQHQARDDQGRLHQCWLLAQWPEAGAHLV